MDMVLQNAVSPSSSLGPATFDSAAAESQSSVQNHTSALSAEHSESTGKLISATNSQISLSNPSASNWAADTLQIPKLSPATTELLARVNGNGNTAAISAAKNDALSKDTDIPGAAYVNTDDSSMAKSNSLHNRAAGGASSRPILARPMQTTGSSSATIDASATPNTDINTANVQSIPKLENGGSLDPASSSALTQLPSNGAPIGIPAAPVQLTPGSRKRRRAPTSNPRINGQKRGRKRRSRKNDDDEGIIKAGDSSSDDSSEEHTPVATQTKSGRQIHRPTVFAPLNPSPESPAAPTTEEQSPRKKRRVYRKGKEINVLCKQCERGHSPPSNAIVFCDDCNRAWHQFCHDPPIEGEVINVKETQWFCKECRPVDSPMDDTAQSQTVDGVSSVIEYQPVIPSNTKVGGSHFSAENKKYYLAGLSHTALVNLISDLSDSNPDVPIFPSNLLELRKSTVFSTAPVSTPQRPSYPMGPPPPVASSATTPSTLTPAPSTVSSILPSKPMGIVPNAGPSAAAPIAPDDDDDDEYIYVEEHRLYPRAGNGFRLPPQSEILHMLLEDPACPTFSHALHGPAKARAEANVLQAVGGVV